MTTSHADNGHREQFLHSKAGRLQLLRSIAKDFVVDDFLTCSAGAWKANSPKVLNSISSHFRAAPLIIRSSAVGEDEYGGRLAGALRSESGIISTDTGALRAAVTRVVSSFAKNGRQSLSSDQFIVQRFVTGVRASGVILTWDLWQDRPYYVINHESGTGKTNRITSGQQGETLRILRGFAPNKTPSAWRNLLKCVKQIERCFSNEVLDIEFAIDDQDSLHIFQVRSLCSADNRKQRRRTLSANRTLVMLRSRVTSLLRGRSNGVGSKTALSDMADWNPAEMLGPRPPHLDRSLYRFLITSSAWNAGRVSLGYTDVQPAELMVCLGDKPYIDIRVSLNSLTPAILPARLRRALASYGLAKLVENPELHDKIEFEVAFSCFDFRLEERLTQLRTFGLAAGDVAHLRDCLRMFTNSVLVSSKRIIDADISLLKQMRSRQLLRINSARTLEGHLSRARKLLFECRDHAIPAFVRLARLAFVGLAFLKSLRLERIISSSFYESFFGSLNTIANEVHSACIQVSQRRLGLRRFLDDFGHLRPMSYDITSARYADMSGAFWLRQHRPRRHNNERNDKPAPQEVDRITVALKTHGIQINGWNLLRFIRDTVEAREYAKFVFTKHVSDALEHVASCGSVLELTRTEVANLSAEDIFAASANENLNKQRLAHSWRAIIRRAQAAREMASAAALPPNIVDPLDLFVVKYPKTHPNFVTHKRVQGNSFVLARKVSHLNAASLQNSIVLLESADPGYDWLFSYNPKGIITKYGGAGSHMTIRCAAFDVPAAIGCGEDLFERLARTHSVVLDCRTGIVAPLV